MFVLEFFLQAVAKTLHSVLWIYIWIVIIQAVISWVRPDPFSPIVQILHKLTFPAYRLIRSRIPTVFSGVDLAPLILILFLEFLDYFLVPVLFRLASVV